MILICFYYMDTNNWRLKASSKVLTQLSKLNKVKKVKETDLLEEKLVSIKI